MLRVYLFCEYMYIQNFYTDCQPIFLIESKMQPSITYIHFQWLLTRYLLVVHFRLRHSHWFFYACIIFVDYEQDLWAMQRCEPCHMLPLRIRIIICVSCFCTQFLCAHTHIFVFTLTHAHVHEFIYIHIFFRAKILFICTQLFDELQLRKICMRSHLMSL